MVGVVGGRILNGTMEGDRKGNYTYVGPRGGSVIDYVVINETCQGLVNNFSIDDRVDSDHMPLIIELKFGRKELERGERIGKEEKGRRVKISWSKEAIRRYRENTEETVWKMGEEEEDRKKIEQIKGVGAWYASERRKFGEEKEEAGLQRMLG